MSSDAVVVATGLSKQFALQASAAGHLRRALVGGEIDPASEYWALRDVSFELRRGETLGVMGRNGCGKSTLLEIIAGTLAPTRGQVEVKGELAALLELGAAFSPDLTGRENVFVYGSLLGLSRVTIRERFDEIVDFAELHDFIDEPVKTYSSGMFVRLAFSTAVSSTPDILVIDEALAVGDEAFQRRCFGRFEEMKQSGVSMLFVSHSAGTMMELCDRVLLLDRGESLRLGPPDEVIRHYHRLIYAEPEQHDEIREAIRSGASADEDDLRTDGTTERSTGGGAMARVLEEERFDPGLESKSLLSYATRGARIGAPAITTPSGQPLNILSRGGLYHVCFRVEFARDAFQVRFGTLVKNIVGTDLGGVVTAAPGEGLAHVSSGEVIEVEVPIRMRLVPGTYFANVGVVGTVDGGEVFLHRITDALAFRVLEERSVVATGGVDLSSDTPARIERASSA